MQYRVYSSNNCSNNTTNCHIICSTHSGLAYAFIRSWVSLAVLSVTAPPSGRPGSAFCLSMHPYIPISIIYILFQSITHHKNAPNAKLILKQKQATVALQTLQQHQQIAKIIQIFNTIPAFSKQQCSYEQSKQQLLIRRTFLQYFLLPAFFIFTFNIAHFSMKAFTITLCLWAILSATQALTYSTMQEVAQLAPIDNIYGIDERTQVSIKEACLINVYGMGTYNQKYRDVLKPISKQIFGKTILTSYDDVRIVYANGRLVIKFTEVTNYYSATIQGSCNIDNYAIYIFDVNVILKKPNLK